MSLISNVLRRVKHKLSSEITEVPAIFSGSRFRSLDGIRAIAIMLVIFAHFGINHLFRGYQPFVSGSAGVHIFFVLSGFLITTLLIKEQVETGAISLWRFYTRRALRILPAVYLFLILLFVLNFIYHLRVPGIDFIYSILVLKNLPISNIPLTAHLWTLAVEMQFYLIFPALLTLGINRYLCIVSGIIVLVLGVSLFSICQPAWLNLSPSTHFISKIILYAFWKGPFIILIGSVASILAFKKLIRTERSEKSYFFGFALLVLAIVIQSPGFIFYTRFISEFVSACVVAYVILLGISTRGFLSVVLNNPALTWLGVLSYSLYIWQEFFLGSHIWQPWLKLIIGLPFLLTMVLKLLLLIVIAYLSYRFYEKPFLTLKRKFK